MGHIRLGDLPQTRPWMRVIEMLGDDPAAPEIAIATLIASHKALYNAARDPAIVHSFWLLTQVPMCARTEDFSAALRAKGIDVSNAPSLLEISGAFSAAVDSRLRGTTAKTDLGEMGQIAAAETLVSSVGRELPSLFGADTKDVQNVLTRFSTRNGFATLAKSYFSRLTERFLLYYLSREVSTHIGPKQSLANIDEHIEFREALTVHCNETTHIVEDYAGDWYSKKKFEARGTGITERHVSNFLAYAFTKLRAELGKRAERWSGK